MIYEGANGVQAMDLVGRKLAMNGGRAIQLFFKIVAEEVAQAKQNEKLTKFAEALEKANGQLQAATMWLMQNGMTNPNNAGAAAYRSEEHTSELQSLMRNSYAVFCLKKKNNNTNT